MKAWSLMLATALLAACSKEPPPPAPPKLVRTLVVGAADAATARSYSGELRARYETPLGFRVGGKIMARLVDAGARVKAGQPLARLDAADATLQAAQAEANRALAEADARRFRDLRARNFVSQAALDGKETALKAADAQAGLAKNQSAYTTLTADHDGVVAAVLAEPGQVVTFGQPVLRVARDGEREVAIALPEGEVAGLAPGAQAEIGLWSAGGKTYRGRLRELAPAADAATRTYAARVTVLDPDAALALGMTASVRFAAPAAPKTPIVPLAALYQQGGEPAVWLVGADQSVTLRKVRVAAYTDAGAAIAEGLSPGERIVAAGVHKLSAGEKVRLADAK